MSVKGTALADPPSDLAFADCVEMDGVLHRVLKVNSDEFFEVSSDE
jgi:hypothetical protein